MRSSKRFVLIGIVVQQAKLHEKILNLMIGVGVQVRTVGVIHLDAFSLNIRQRS